MNMIQEAQRVLEIEIKSIEALRQRLNSDFEKAVDTLHNCAGKIVVTGIGKSGQIGQKISSTFSSTGSPSVFLHPAESSHGDLGLVDKKDILLAISYGGESEELYPILKFAKRKGLPIIALTAKPESTLGASASVLLNISVEEEACPLKLAPTSSSTVTLVLGDALAMVLLKKRGFNKENYAELHPGGSLGRKLLTRVKDVMYSEGSIPLVKTNEEMKTVLTLMTSKEVRGVAGVVNDDGAIMGIITDGDIRRTLEKGNDLFSSSVLDLMSNAPKTIEMNELAEKALFLMEQFRIQSLFVLDKESATPMMPVGILHLQDLLKARLR
ncbi:MAG: KpsF/GutQ family sugar-phosphate isomerase [Bdellovibrionaceae bacterium]|nr:KpsF/GutQ family sugar-phosphate isomerase [Pseudobdellovibrionaceae bacterium]